MLNYGKLREEFKALLESYSKDELIECANRIEREMRFDAISESTYEVNNVSIETIKSNANFTNSEANKYDNSSYNELAA